MDFQNAPRNFLCASLFLDKWLSVGREDICSCLEYLQNSKLERNSTWFEGIAPGFPSTNNGLEAINQSIKRQNTFRQRLELSRFLTIVERDILKNWSCDRDMAQKAHTAIAEEPPRSLALWTAAYQWASSKAQSLRTKNTIYVGAEQLETDLKSAVKNQEEMFESSSWPSFDEYKENRNSAWKLRLTDNKLFCKCPQIIKK